jgi:hypothetical protein
VGAPRAALGTLVHGGGHDLGRAPRARVAGVKLLPRRTVLAPRGGYGGVVLMTETQTHGVRNLYRETIANGEFTVRPPAWCELR